MPDLTTVVILVVLFVSVGFIIEVSRKTKEARRLSNASNEGVVHDIRTPEAQPLVTADEVGPTQTGRYRVQQMLQKTERPAQASTPDLEASDEDELFEEEPAYLEEDEAALPDPFDK